MNWNKDKSILLSQIILVIFALILLAFDVFMYPVIGLFLNLRNMNHGMIYTYFMITMYSCSVFAWIILFFLHKLILNIKHADVFVLKNVKYMRIISWSCIAVSIVLAVSSLYYIVFIVVAFAAAFMSLIVRIVKNAFQQAIDMKSELDLTI